MVPSAIYFYTQEKAAPIDDIIYGASNQLHLSDKGEREAQFQAILLETWEISTHNVRLMLSVHHLIGLHIENLRLESVRSPKVNSTTVLI